VQLGGRLVSAVRSRPRIADSCVAFDSLAISDRLSEEARRRVNRRKAELCTDQQPESSASNWDGRFDKCTIELCSTKATRDSIK
jgi:CRISPR/Cas system Type II protein with McrA/HNH and RuvC-like nuclease domain